MSKVYEYYNDERMSLEDIKALEERIKCLESTLNKIAKSGEQANPIHLIEMARTALDGEPVICDSKFKKFGGDTGVDADFEDNWYDDKLKLKSEQKESEKRMKALHRAIFESQG
jgi:hypothetical protein